MAGEPSLFLVYKDFAPDERSSDSWYASQALADAAAAAGGADFSAHKGAVEVPNSWAAGWIYQPSDGKWRTLDVADLDELGQRKYAARILHDALRVWRDGVIAVRSEKPSGDVERVCAFLAMAHWAACVVFTNANRTWTAAQQIAWASAMARGASDGATVQEFYQSAHAIDENEVPQEACAWANPNDARRVTVSQARSMSTKDTQGTPWFDAQEADLTMSDLGNGAWIEAIT